MKTLVRSKNLEELSLEAFNKILKESFIFTPVTENQYFIKRLFSNYKT